VEANEREGRSKKEGKKPRGKIEELKSTKEVRKEKRKDCKRKYNCHK
jgi:hypothetical protein